MIGSQLLRLRGAKSVALVLFGCVSLLTAPCAHTATQTIILIRHGEKPLLGRGQLTCRGLNRALALPGVLEAAFGRPNLIFAPDPAHEVFDPGGAFDYVRPLATVEPTAIAFALPVHAKFGYSDIAALEAELAQSRYWGSTVLIGWEHVWAARMARDLMAAHGGNAEEVPAWGAGDYDSIYVVRIDRTATGVTAAFEHTREGLDGQSDQCPGGSRSSPHRRE